MGEPTARFWRAAAARLRRRLNLGVWLGRVLPVWTAGSLGFSVVLLWDRGRGGALAGYLAAAFALFLFTTGLLHLLRGRSSYFDVTDALVLLDEKLGLHNRLSSARAGVGEWPSIPARRPAPLQWRLERSLLPLAFSAALVALAASLPVTVEEPSAAVPPAPPSSWKEMERALEVLREEVPVKEEAVEAYEARLEELKSKLKEEWFGHGSLEASDSLREELVSDMRALAGAISDVSSSLEELEPIEGETPERSRRLKERRLREALDDLELGDLPLEAESTRELHTLARGGKTRRATKEEIEKWKAMRERLYHGLPGGEQIIVALSRTRSGEGSDRGKGGVSRGPGEAPLDLSAEPAELGSTRIESVRGEDASRGLSGATLGFSMGEHEVDTGGFRVDENGGPVAATGEGGDLVWTQSLLPSERRVLQKYFK